jgi:hypothetical protein
MRKLINSYQENLIECDNESCDFVIPNDDPSNPEDGFKYINSSCPMCGDNLLTVEDYQNHERVTRIVNRINFLFSWITIFFPKSKEKEISEIKVHKGVNIKQK